MMELGFETIGNATVICHDRVPVLATDPWITPQAYFGSWTLPHVIPPRQMEAIRQCKFIWFSHGHPDHLNPYSLGKFQNQKILIPSHFGDRIYMDLKSQGFDVTTLKDREWFTLSDRIRVLCIADYNQDAILLIDLGGDLIVNSNDAGYTGWERFVRRIVPEFNRTFRLAISGVGEADMCNFFDENGNRIEFLPDVADVELGEGIARHTDRLGLRYFVPFSSLHKYQREDSIWANRYVGGIHDYKRGYRSTSSEILPAYVRFDLINDRVECIDPDETPNRVFAPEDFGDNWSDALSNNDVLRAQAYFGSVTHLTNYLGFINLRVGGRDNVIELNRRKFDRGITFEAPRKSLMTAINGEIFDDLMIGNFVKTKLHGEWGNGRLYPDFTPYIAKFADNGRAKNADELRAYFKYYREKAPWDYSVHMIEQYGINRLISILAADSATMKATKFIFNLIKMRSSRKVVGRSTHTDEI